MRTQRTNKSSRTRLLLTAWKLNAKAQRLAADTPLSAVRSELLATPHLPTGVLPEEALWAARWAALLQRRLLGRLDTCLVRSLVAGALVADGRKVAVRIGVHSSRSPDDLLDAHAWLTVGDRAVPSRSDQSEPFEEVLALSMERSS